MLVAHVPRNLRVRSSIQVSSTRVPARAFVIICGLVFVGGMLVIAGADLMETVRMTGVTIVLALAVFELRVWGRSTQQVARIIWRHEQRPRQLRLEPLVITVPAENSPPPALRRPCWQR